MKNNNLLIKASKKVALAVLAASMLVSPCAAIPVSAEIIEGQWETTYTGEDVPEYIREQEGEGISVVKSRMYNDEGWMSYTNAAQGRFPSGTQWYLYGTNEDGTEYLADEIWVYYDLSGGRRERAWYEKGVQIKVEQLESVKEEDSNSGSSDSSTDSSTDNSTDNSNNSGSDSTGSDNTTDNGNGETSGDSADNDGSNSTIDSKYPTFGWYKENGKAYWYEDNIRQGTEDDPKGVVGDGTIRGREIYDFDSDGWYWLDAVYDGAKAVSKEVWMPYIYQDEDKWDEEELIANANSSGGMAQQVKKAIENKSGKWVRYDAEGKMYKGWYTVEGADAELYPEQEGNRYYYDPKTGLMAKGWTPLPDKTFGSVYYKFDEETGALLYPTEEEYFMDVKAGRITTGVVVYVYYEQLGEVCPAKWSCLPAEYND